MKKFSYMLLIPFLALIMQSAAFAECNCKLPAYKDEIDFLIRYTGCLDECLNTQIQQVRLKIDAAGTRITDLESQVNRLNSQVKNLEAELTSIKAKNKPETP
jgi:outer membrane murein-binding lipoprotein Lpp